MYEVQREYHVRPISTFSCAASTTPSMQLSVGEVLPLLLLMFLLFGVQKACEHFRDVRVETSQREQGQA